MSFTEVEQELNNIGVKPIDSTTQHLIFANSNKVYRGNRDKIEISQLKQYNKQKP